MLLSTNGRVSNLTRLNLLNNNFEGTISTELGTLSQVESIDLSDNRFTRSVPSELWSTTKLSRLNLAHNRLASTDAFPRILALSSLSEVKLSDIMFLLHR